MAGRQLRGLVVGLAALASAVWTPEARCDPYPSTTAQVEVDAERRVLEVALRVQPEQLEEALANLGSPSIDWQPEAADAAEPSADDRAILRYLQSTFQLSTADDQDFALRWVGKEMVSHRQAWLYFEVEYIEDNGEPSQLWLSQRMFFELGPRQVNTVRIKIGDRQTALIFDRQQPRQRLLSLPSDGSS